MTCGDRATKVWDGADFDRPSAPRIPPLAYEEMQPILAMDRPRLYFIHIPKTAGSSLRSALTEAVGTQCSLLLSTGHKRKQLEAAPLAQLRVIGGHIPFNS